MRFDPREGRLAIQRLAKFKPFKVEGPMVVKWKLQQPVRHFGSPGDAEQIDERSWLFRVKDFKEVCQKVMNFKAEEAKSP